MPPSYPRFLNGEVHQWYRMVLGYPDHLVTDLITRLELKPGDRVLDPFCGSGTTLIECMKQGIATVGLDANPASVMATCVKTDWLLDPEALRGLLKKIDLNVRQRLSAPEVSYQTDPTYVYIEGSGMLKRGWISVKPLRKAITIKREIKAIETTPRYRDALTLCLLSEVVYGASNVKFGPEIYCSKRKADPDVVGGFSRRVLQMANDLEGLWSQREARATVLRGDARTCAETLDRYGKFNACICSPPYPTEHDYTRNTRLELAFLESVTDLASLRKIKTAMIRSHSKNIYKSDADATHVKRYKQVQSLADTLRKRVKGKHGFVGLYPDVVQHYFGGMKRHLVSLRDILTPGARCAYVVGDQSSYCGLPIPTAKILSTILRSTGYNNVKTYRWRGRWSSTRSREVSENVVLFTRSAS